MKYIKRLLSLLIFILVAANSYGQGNTYYISKKGSDNNSGSSVEKAWASINKANKELKPGDIVYILKGVYNETIRPDRSGEPGKYIKYVRYNSDEVIITGVSNGADFSDRTYLFIDGFTILEPTGSWVTFLPNGSHCVVQNCYMEGAGSYNGLRMVNGANYNKILNNVLKDKCVGTNPDNADGGPNDIITCFNSSYNLFEGNKIYGGIHNGLNIQRRGDPTDYNVIRNNYFECRWHGSIDLFQGPSHTLVENNIIVDGGEDHETNYCGTNKDRSMERGRQRGIKSGAVNGIIRRNVMVNDGYGVELHGIASASTHPENNHIYNNTFFANYNGVWMRDATGGDVKRNKIYNNILYKNKETNLVVQLKSSNNADNAFVNNNISSGEVSITSNYPYEWTGNVSVNPLFADEDKRDLRLTSKSPMIDAGSFLTKTTNAGSGRTIQVEDAYFFTDGWGIIEADEIQLEGQSNTVQIVKIDYNSNTITVSYDITWSKGQGVSLPFSGKSMDMGAHEFESEDGSTGEVPSAPSPLLLKASNVSQTQVDLEWNDNTTGESGFVLERKKDGASDFIELVTTQANITTNVDKNLEPSTIYYYRVKPVVDGKSGSYSNTLKVTTLELTNESPVASISVDIKEGSYPLTVNFSGAKSNDPDGQIETYIWTFGDGTNGNGKTVTHIYEEAGEFEARLVVTDNRGAESNKNIIITVTEPDIEESPSPTPPPADGSNILPIAAFTVSKSVGTFPMKVEFNASNSKDSDGEIVKYKWDFGDGNTDSGKSPTHTYLGQGNFLAVLTVMDDRKGTQTFQKTIRVSVTPESSGNIYYVSSSSGNDNNSGLSEKEAWRTLNKVNATKFRPGDSVLFKRNDTWKERLLVTYSGQPLKYITYSSYGTGNYPVFAPEKETEVIQVKSDNYISVNDIHAIASSNQSGVSIAGGSKYVKIQDCIIEGNADKTSKRGIEYSYAVDGKYPTHPIITNCEVSKFEVGVTGFSGLHEGGVIADNYIHSLTGSGSDLIKAIAGDYEGLSINNNLLTGWVDNAVDLDGGSHITVEFNQIYEPGPNSKGATGSGINAGGTGDYQSIGNVIRYNKIFNLRNTANTVYTGIATHAGANGEIYGNLIFDIHGNGISVIGKDNWNIYHNTSIYASESGIYLGDGLKNVTLINNIFGGAKFNITVNGSGSVIKGKTNLFLNTISSDHPVGGNGAYKGEGDLDMTLSEFRNSKVFKNEAGGNYKPSYKSPLIDAGTYIAGYLADLDIRPIIGTPDIGSFEYQDNSIREVIPPYNLRAKETASGVITLNWEEDGQKGLFVIYRSSSQPANFSPIDTLAAGRKMYLDEGLALGITYQYKIKVIDNLEQSDYSNLISVTTSNQQEETLAYIGTGDSANVMAKIKTSATTGIAPLEVTLDGTESTGSNQESSAYLWKVNGKEMTGDQINYTFNKAGEYNISLQVTGFNGQTSVATTVISVQPPVTHTNPIATILSDDRKIILPLDSIKLIGSGSDAEGEIIAYQWSYNGSAGLQLDGDNSSELIVRNFTPGTYSFELTVTDEEGMTGSDLVRVIAVKENPDIIASKAFTPNGDGIDDFWIIENVDMIENCKLSIFDRAGQRVFNAAPYQNNWDATLNGQPLPSKDYYYIIDCKSGAASGGIQVIR